MHRWGGGFGMKGGDDESRARSGMKARAATGQKLWPITHSCFNQLCSLHPRDKDVPQRPLLLDSDMDLVRTLHFASCWSVSLLNGLPSLGKHTTCVPPSSSIQPASTTTAPKALHPKNLFDAHRKLLPVNLAVFGLRSGTEPMVCEKDVE